MHSKQRGHSLYRAILLSVIWAGLVSGVIFPRAGAAAQDGGNAQVSALDVAQFPTITFVMEAYDTHGNFMLNLQPDDVQVLENDAALPVDALKLVPTGLQVILAYNVSPQMATHGGGSASIYENIQKTLLGWAQTQLAGSGDDFTLITNDGLQTIRQSEPQRWVDAISSYQPDLNRSKPGLGSLSQALDIATDPNPRPNMRRALLYVTTPPADNSLNALPNIAERARQVGLRVFIWVVAPAGKETGAGIDALGKLAADTGGSVRISTTGADLVSPEIYLRPLRQLYQVTYTSAVTQGGTQRVAVAIGKTNADTGTISGEKFFNINILPPNPIFLAPPAKIERAYPKGRRDAPAEPGEVEIAFLVEFPDGHPRALRRADLYVDGVKIAENSSAPFDRFTWVLSGYDVSANHILKVEVEDILGTRQSSSEIPVEILVETPRGLNLIQNIQPQRLIIAAAILLAALALGVVLWLGGQRKLFPDRNQRQALKDPVTQPVHIQQDQPRRKLASQERPSWPRLTALPKSPAWLAPVDDGNQPLPTAVIAVQRREMTFGSNPRQATCVLNLPSVDPLHARLYQPRDGEYFIADAGSVAGTWVNYSPVLTDGTRLQHGDLISIGQNTFRFELAKPAKLRKPKVTEYVESE